MAEPPVCKSPKDRIEEQVDKVPLLGDIPVVDSLFSRKSIKREETELIVLVRRMGISVSAGTVIFEPRPDASAIGEGLRLGVASAAGPFWGTESVAGVCAGCCIVTAAGPLLGSVFAAGV